MKIKIEVCCIAAGSLQCKSTGSLKRDRQAVVFMQVKFAVLLQAVYRVSHGPYRVTLLRSSAPCIASLPPRNKTLQYFLNVSLVERSIFKKHRIVEKWHDIVYKLMLMAVAYDGKLTGPCKQLMKKK